MSAPSIGALAIVGAAIAADLVLLPVALLGVIFMSTDAGAVTAAAEARECAGAVFADYGPGGATRDVDGRRFTGEQLTNAQTIITVAVHRHLPRRAAVIAVTTAITESGIRNLGYGDRDSLGLFQQRPSQGWGTPEQVLNPVYAAGVFYDHLQALPGWSTMSPGVAEQAVQRSGHPDRYAGNEPIAATLVNRYWQGPDNPLPSPTAAATGGGLEKIDLAHGGCPDKGRSQLPLDPEPKKLPEHFDLPADPAVNAAVSYVLAQVGKPYVWGAEGPDAFDCSGLMQAAWAHAGVAISRTTSTQVHDGVAVGSLSQVEPGDLLFIPGADGTPAHPGHVGMYIGHGYIVDAYDEHHGVIVEPLKVWEPKIVAIRRVVTGDHSHNGGGSAPQA